MSLMDVTHESLSRQLNREVPEVYVIIAKHSVLGMADDGIREIIGCTEEELAEVQNDPIYREVRLIAGAMHANEAVSQTSGLDKLEGLALNNLVRRLELPNVDPEFALKVLAVANKAQRRTSAGKEQGILDATGGKTAKISLTTRLVRSFSRDGSAETQMIEKQLSIGDGSMQNPSFEEINGLLSVNNTPALPQRLEVSTHTPDISFDELDSDLQDRGA